MERPATEADIVGKTIARILQTEWEQREASSSGDFYVELTDGTLIYLGVDGSLRRIDSEARKCINLHDAEIDSSDAHTGIGSSVEKVLKNTGYGVYLVLSEQHYLTPDDEPYSIEVLLLNRKDFVSCARDYEFFDYWTGKPYITDNMRAIDIIVESSVDDLVFWQSRDLSLTIGRVKDGDVDVRVTVSNRPCGDLWKARFIVPELGTYQIQVQRLSDDFLSEIQIDESVIAEGFLKIRVI